MNQKFSFAAHSMNVTMLWKKKWNVLLKNSQYMQFFEVVMNDLVLRFLFCTKNKMWTFFIIEQ